MDREMVEEQIKNDLGRVSQDLEGIDSQINSLAARRAALAEEKKILQGAYEFYSRDGRAPSPAASASESSPTFASLTIAAAAAAVLRMNDNAWMTTRALESAFRDHGKQVAYNALDITLKDKSKVFEMRKAPGTNRNQFRLRAEVLSA
jgi:hypothetical protein